MNKVIKILGDGQIWNVKGVSPDAPDKTFEDLFSGRALGQIAARESGHLFRFKEKGKITGLSVTRALLSNNPQAENTARLILKDLAQNGAWGIEALIKGKGFKKNWSGRQKNYWRDLDIVVIGGGVSEGKTGEILVSAIKKYLSQDSLSDVKIYQARFPGKEAGFLGAVVNIIKVIYNEAKEKGLKLIAAIGLDLGRDQIGVGLLPISAHSEKILKQKKDYWIFKHSVKVPYKSYLKNFLDSRRDYTTSERKLGIKVRSAILRQIANLIIEAQTKARELGFACSQNIGVAVPGSTSCGYILDSTDYLPLFRKQDGFNFAKDLKTFLAKKNLSGFNIHIINDGIAAGLANIYFNSFRIKSGKFGFFGVGSGLGGCVGLIKTK